MKNKNKVLRKTNHLKLAKKHIEALYSWEREEFREWFSHPFFIKRPLPRIEGKTISLRRKK